MDLLRWRPTEDARQVPRPHAAPRRGRARPPAADHRVNAALDTMPVEAEASARAVVSEDGREIRLTLSAEAGAAAAIVLDPVLAVALAQRLIAAAMPRLSSRVG